MDVTKGWGHHNVIYYFNRVLYIMDSGILETIN